jgi:dTDP-4-dehydrorhamnose reductase
MVVGASAVLRREIECACDLRDLAVQFRGTEELASGDPDAIIGPDGWAIVFAGLLRECREDRLPHRGVEQIERLAAAATAAGYHVTLLSSQQVFGSARHAPYLECDGPAPQSDEGHLATAMERSVATLNPAALIARAALCFADRAHPNIEPEQEPCVHGAWFPTGIAGAASCSLTYLPDLIRVVLDLIVDGERGIWHLANRGEMTVAGVQQTLAGAASSAQTDGALVSYVLDTTRGTLLPHIDAALARAGYGAGSGSSMAPWRISASL